MKAVLLNENKEGHFYSHWTNINGLIGILKSNKLFSQEERSKFLTHKNIISTTREQTVPNWVKEKHNIDYVRIVLDMEKISSSARDTKIKSFNYMSSKNSKHFEYEDSIITGDTIYEVTFERGGFKITYNAHKKEILKVEPIKKSRSEKVIMEKKNTFLFKGERYKASFDTIGKQVYDLTLYKISDDGNETYIQTKSIPSHQNISTNEGINNILDYIDRVEIADVLLRPDLYDYLTISGTYDTIDSYIEKSLIKKRTAGLNVSQRSVEHNINTLEEFLGFLKRKLKNKLKVYKTPKEWYRDYSSDTYNKEEKTPFKVTKETYKDRSLYFISYKTPTNKVAKEEMVAVVTINPKLAIKRVQNSIKELEIMRYGEFDDSHLEEIKQSVKIIPCTSKKEMKQVSKTCSNLFDNHDMNIKNIIPTTDNQGFHSFTQFLSFNAQGLKNSNIRIYVDGNWYFSKKIIKIAKSDGINIVQLFF